jgi:hypothetical protein
VRKITSREFFNGLDGHSTAEVARLAQGMIDASNQIGVAQMTAQIPVVMQSTGRNWVKVAILACHPGWAPENDTALMVE